MKTEQEQRRAIRQILFDANEICQAIPCENELCMYYGDYRCYDNVIVDKLIRAGYGNVSEYKAEIERLNSHNGFLQCVISHSKDMMDEAVKEAKIDVLTELKKQMFEREYMGVKYRERIFYESDIDQMIEEIENE